MPKLINLKGQFFGEWEVLDKAPSQNKRVMWLCKCSCGAIKEVRGEHLRDGTSTSCGCQQKKKATEICKIIGQSNAKDLSKQHIDFLTVLEPTLERSANGCIIWKCQCDCGSIIYKSSNDLIHHKTCHCGCQTIISQGELIIQQILQDNNIEFEMHKSFNDCKDVNPLPFDFFVNNSYLIEYDGKQHFSSLAFNGGETALAYIQKHDKIKNDWCKQHNIPLIRIPYTHTKITFTDLLLDTTKFLCF